MPAVTVIAEASATLSERQARGLTRGVPGEPCRRSSCTARGKTGWRGSVSSTISRPSSVKALLRLSGTRPTAMRELAAAFACDASYITAVVDALEQRGLARREPHPTDRRVRTVVLTETGQRVAASVLELLSEPPPSIAVLVADRAAPAGRSARPGRRRRREARRAARRGHSRDPSRTVTGDMRTHHWSVFGKIHGQSSVDVQAFANACRRARQSACPINPRTTRAVEAATFYAASRQVTGEVGMKGRSDGSAGCSTARSLRRPRCTGRSFERTIAVRILVVLAFAGRDLRLAPQPPSRSCRRAAHRRARRLARAPADHRSFLASGFLLFLGFAAAYNGHQSMTAEAEIAAGAVVGLPRRAPGPASDAERHAGPRAWSTPPPATRSRPSRCAPTSPTPSPPTAPRRSRTRCASARPSRQATRWVRPHAREAAIDAFLAESERNGWRTTVLGAGEELTDLWRARGMRGLCIGREVVLDVATFSMKGREFRNVRQAVSRATNAGVTTSDRRRAQPRSAHPGRADRASPAAPTRAAAPSAASR